MIPQIPCIIFAGGKSSRMGRDKSLLPFGGFSTLTEFQYRRLRKIFEKVYISTKQSDKFDFDADFIEDKFNVYAPSAGFVSCFEALTSERIFVISVDTPFVSHAIVKQLLEADTADADATIAKSSSGTHPLVGIYHRSLLPAFKQMLQDDNHKLGRLLQQNNTTFVEFEDDEAFFNCNHPDEYSQALTKL